MAAAVNGARHQEYSVGGGTTPGWSLPGPENSFMTSSHFLYSTPPLPNAAAGDLDERH